ncbi:hypothetical protein [Streptomyces sp. UNOB3_S3]|uniref:hypothetical protein n=1 Tax=Streptomyces sp. UNOB3_S3 TaxID=2871682 RepID=UPI001E419CB3|nr:hypothetical protein [Streptomyces sp. UNOB3_S3]MCC3778092.1 hypothetical protein [Streptomyces sp. UNOB3_S3]
MTSLFDRLDTEEAIVRGELTVLREKVAQGEERLAHLAITRATLASLGATGAEGSTSEPSSSVPGGPASSGAGPGADGPMDDEACDPAGESSETELEELPLEVARERILALLAQTGRAVKLQDLVPAIGESRVETTRSRLKALMKKGLIVEDPVAWFALKSAATPGQAAEEVRVT